jgi:RND family efflux transporter MFP subunit
MKRALFLVLLAACRRNSDPAADPGSGNQPAPFARGDQRKSTQTDQVGYIGVLSPRESFEVTSPFTSKVEKVYVNLGDTVTAGQPLALLDSQPLKEQLQIAKAAQKEAAIAAGAAASKAAMERRAFRAGVSSKAAVDAAAFEAGQAGAAVEQHKAKVNQIEQRLKDTRLTARIAGKIALRYVDEGARVSEGQAVMRVISSGEMFVKFAIPGNDAKKLKAGDKIEIKIDGKPSVDGVVKTVSPELDPIAQMIVAEAEIEGGSGELQSGVVCRIVPRGKPDAKPAPNKK